MAISFVGSYVGTHAATSAQTVAFTNLRDESNAQPTLQEGDVVRVAVTCASTVDRTEAQLTPAGYTPAHADLYANDSNDANLLVSYKVMGPTPDASVAIPASNATTAGVGYEIKVLRGVDPTNPLDVTPTTATGTNTGVANAPAITPATTGAWIDAVGAAAVAAGAVFTNPAGMDTTTNHFRSATITTTTNDANIAGALYSGWTSGSYDPAVFGGSTSTNTGSWAAVTIAWRPLRAAGAATGEMALSGSAEGTVPLAPITAASAGSFEPSGSAAGLVALVGGSSGAFDLTGAADGAAGVAGLASGSFALTGAAAGTVATAAANATAAGTMTFAGATSGLVKVAAGGAGTIALTGNSAAKAAISAAGTGALSLAGTAAGAAALDARASGSFTVAGTGVLQVTSAILGAAAGDLTLGGSTAGAAALGAVASGTFALTGAGVMQAASAILGEAAGDFALSGSATVFMFTQYTPVAPVAVRARRSIAAIARRSNSPLAVRRRQPPVAVPARAGATTTINARQSVVRISNQ